MNSPVIDCLLNILSEPNVPNDGLIIELIKYHLIFFFAGGDLHTRTVAVVIFVPPAAPAMIRTCPLFSSTTIVGAIDDMGLFLGSMKLAGLGGTPK